MDIKKRISIREKVILFSILGAITFLCVAFTCASYIALVSNLDRNIGGEVGLRNYFETGDGTSANPYVIARPNQFYNLTRLQNFGVFNEATKSHFKLGYNFTDDLSEEELFANPNYDSTDPSSQKYISYLDMSGTTYQDNLISIGSEAQPFYGEFNGNKKVINGLRIHSSPEDIGVFGYVTSGGNIHDVAFSNLDVYSDGYSTNPLSTIFSNTLVDGSYIDLYNNGTNDNINSNSAITTGIWYENSTLTNLSFRSVGTTVNGVTYSIKCCNNAVTIDSGNGYGSISSEYLTYSNFANTNNAEMDSRVYLVAQMIGSDGFIIPTLFVRIVCNL
jgi:hypothetical protein